MITPIDRRRLATFLAAASVVTVLLAAGPRLNDAADIDLATTVRDIGQLKALDAQLTQEILLLKAGIVRDYDSLESITRATNFTVANLDLPNSTRLAKEARDLTALLDELKANIAQRVEHVERFKSKNAIARNSSIYFTHLLIKSAKDVERLNLMERDRSRLAELRTLMLVYGLSRGPGIEKELRAVLSEIRDRAALFDARRQRATTFLTQIANHGEVMIKANHELDRLIAQIISPRSTQLLELIDYKISALFNIEFG